MTVPKLLNILVHTLQLFLAIWQGLHSFSTWALSESIHLLCLFKDLLGFALQLQQAVTLGEEFGQVMLVFHQMGRHDVI